MNKSKKQLKELNDLYCLVSHNKENFFDKYPSQSVEKYFKKYTKKRLPILNIKKGSNVHGLFDDFQQIVSKNNLNKITKSSNDIKKRLESSSIERPLLKEKTVEQLFFERKELYEYFADLKIDNTNLEKAINDIIEGIK